MAVKLFFWRTKRTAQAARSATANADRSSPETTVDAEMALKRYVSDNQKRVLSIIRSGNFFRFVEERHTHQPELNGLKAYDYWEVVHESGLYESAEVAEREALIGWLQ